MHRHGISRRLTGLRGGGLPVTVKRCDVGQGPEDITWLFSLATNYDTSKGVSLYKPLEKYCEIVEGAFGSSQKVVWWLEYTVNHDPGH